jgi:hypothetical protein
MSIPSSEISTWAARSPIPGIVRNSRSCGANGAKTCSIRSSNPSIMRVRWSMWSRCMPAIALPSAAALRRRCTPKTAAAECGAEAPRVALAGLLPVGTDVIGRDLPGEDVTDRHDRGRPARRRSRSSPRGPRSPGSRRPAPGRGNARTAPGSQRQRPRSSVSGSGAGLAALPSPSPGDRPHASRGGALHAGPGAHEGTMPAHVSR